MSVQDFQALNNQFTPVPSLTELFHLTPGEMLYDACPAGNTTCNQNRYPPAGYYCSNCQPCRCRYSGYGYDSCGELCCPQSPMPYQGRKGWCFDKCPTGQTSYGGGIDWNKCFTDSARITTIKNSGIVNVKTQNLAYHSHHASNVSLSSPFNSYDVLAGKDGREIFIKNMKNIDGHSWGKVNYV